MHKPFLKNIFVFIIYIPRKQKCDLCACVWHHSYCLSLDNEIKAVFFQNGIDREHKITIIPPSSMLTLWVLLLVWVILSVSDKFTLWFSLGFLHCKLSLVLETRIICVTTVGLKFSMTYTCKMSHMFTLMTRNVLMWALTLIVTSFATAITCIIVNWVFNVRFITWFIGCGPEVYVRAEAGILENLIGRTLRLTSQK